MSKDKKRLVPVRRFKEFENADAWEQRKLGEVVERFDNLRIPVTSSKREKGITPYYGANGIQDYVQGYTHDGEFVLVAEDGANDLQNYPVHYVNGKVWVNNHAHVLQGKNKMVDNLFLVNAIKQIKIETYLVGGSRAKLNADVMMKLPIKVPTFNEQQKIGEYFSKFDTLITLHQRKLDKLKRVKSAYLTEMFPAEGEREPKRRFPGFTGAWEQRKLVSLFSKFTDGDWIESKDQANTGIRLIQTGNIGITEFINKFGNEKWISEETFKKLNCEEIFPGDIIISRLPDPAGRACILPKLDTRMITAVDCTIARTSREASAEFIVQYLSTQTYFKYVQSCLAGGTRQRISRKNLANFNVSIPTEINEQKQIGFFFKQLDTLIALHQRKLDKLQKLKNAYLNEMFV